MAHNWDILEAVDELAKAKNATQAQIALAWVMAQPAVASTIMGVRTMSQLENNLAAADITFSKDELERLLERASFSIKAAFGDYEAGDWEQDSAITIIVAYKP